MKSREIFKVEGESIRRLRRHCPKCGEGVFLAEHKDRLGCGKCGYTEYKKGSRKKIPEKSSLEIEKENEVSVEASEEAGQKIE